MNKSTSGSTLDLNIDEIELLTMQERILFVAKL